MEEDAKGCLGVEKSKELDKWGGEKKGVLWSVLHVNMMDYVASD